MDIDNLGEEVLLVETIELVLSVVVEGGEVACLLSVQDPLGKEVVGHAPIESHSNTRHKIGLFCDFHLIWDRPRFEHRFIFWNEIPLVNVITDYVHLGSSFGHVQVDSPFVDVELAGVVVVFLCVAPIADNIVR